MNLPPPLIPSTAKCLLTALWADRPSICWPPRYQWTDRSTATLVIQWTFPGNITSTMSTHGHSTDQRRQLKTFAVPSNHIFARVQQCHGRLSLLPCVAESGKSLQDNSLPFHHPHPHFQFPTPTTAGIWSSWCELFQQNCSSHPTGNMISFWRVLIVRLLFTVTTTCFICLTLSMLLTTCLSGT